MTWASAFQLFSSGLAAIGVWFIWELVKEFKAFKVETKTDISTLKIQRSGFEVTVRNAELNIGLRVNEMQKLHNNFSLEVKEALMQFRNDNKNFSKFMKTSLELVGRLNDKLVVQEKELKSLKIQLGEVIIFKSQKNGK